jgi:hypothetical protein
MDIWGTLDRLVEFAETAPPEELRAKIRSSAHPDDWSRIPSLTEEAPIDEVGNY